MTLHSVFACAVFFKTAYRINASVYGQILKFSSHLSQRSKWALWSPVVCRPSVCLTVCKLFTFCLLLWEPFGQLYLNLVQSIIMEIEFVILKIKGTVLYKREIIVKQWKKVCMSLKFFFSRTTAQESKIFTSKNLYIVRILN